MIDSGLKFGCSRYMQRWKRRIGVGSEYIFFPPLPPAALSLYGCGSGQCHSKTKWVFRQQRLCSVSNITKFPFQIPPKSQRYPARCHIYYPVAQLVNPANIQALLEIFPPSSFISISMFTITSSPLSLCHSLPFLKLVFYLSIQ